MPKLSRTSQTRLTCIANNLLGKKRLKEFSLKDANYIDRLQKTYDNVAPHIRFLIRFLLWLLEYESVIYNQTRFSKLDPKTQNEFFTARFTHPKGVIRSYTLRFFQIFCYMVYYADPKISKKYGYPDKQGTIAPRKVNMSGALKHPAKDKTIEVDVLVIGSGAGGAVVAKELAEQGRDVLILEEGGYYKTSDFKSSSTYDRSLTLYRDAGLTTSMGSPPVVIPLGKSVGGTTTINSGTCFRLPNQVVENWQKDFGLTGITTRKLSPFYKQVETILKIKPVPKKVQGPNFGIIDKGVKSLGLQGSPLVRNAPGCEGAGECCFGCPTGAKQSMEISYVPLAFNAGAKMYTFCKATKIKTCGHHVESVQAVFLDPQTLKVKSHLTVKAKTVIVACGSLLTPVFLKRNHIKSSNALGRYLTVHPTAKAVGYFEEKLSGHRGVPQGYQADVLHDKGLMYETVFYPPWFMAMNYSSIGDDHHEFMKRYEHHGIFGFLISDKPNGRVYSMPDGRPFIWYNFGKREHELYLEGLKWLGKILFAAGAKRIYTGVHNHAVISKQEELDKLSTKTVKRYHLETAGFHPLGTCRMGAYPSDSVVNENLRVHDYDNLYVCDGSVFPSSLGVNPQMTIMAFATRLANYLT